MQVLTRPWGAMHYQVQGDGLAVVFANSLGTDLRLWLRRRIDEATGRASLGTYDNTGARAPLVPAAPRTRRV